MCFDKRGKCESVGIMGIMAIVVENRIREGRVPLKDAVCPLSVAAETIGAGLKAFLCHSSNGLRDQNILSESLLLEKLECSDSRTRIAGEGYVNTCVTW